MTDFSWMGIVCCCLLSFSLFLFRFFCFWMLLFILLEFLFFSDFVFLLNFRLVFCEACVCYVSFCDCVVTYHLVFPFYPSLRWYMRLRWHYILMVFYFGDMLWPWKVTCSLVLELNFSPPYWPLIGLFSKFVFPWFFVYSKFWNKTLK